MILDFQETSLTFGMIAFPDYPFANLPRQEPLIEQKFFYANDSRNIGLTGTIDDSEPIPPP